jgi:hypothetical protein
VLPRFSKSTRGISFHRPPCLAGASNVRSHFVEGRKNCKSNYESSVSPLQYKQNPTCSVVGVLMMRVRPGTGVMTEERRM